MARGVVRTMMTPFSFDGGALSQTISSLISSCFLCTDKYCFMEAKFFKLKTDLYIISMLKDDTNQGDRTILKTSHKTGTYKDWTEVVLVRERDCSSCPVLTTQPNERTSEWWQVVL